MIFFWAIKKIVIITPLKMGEEKKISCLVLLLGRTGIQILLPKIRNLYLYVNSVMFPLNLSSCIYFFFKKKDATKTLVNFPAMVNIVFK